MAKRMIMIESQSIVLLIVSVILMLGLMLPSSAVSSLPDEFPQKNAWTRSSPSVVWCNDPASPTTLEVHIVGRTDVARVWLTNLGTSNEEGRAELFDDGTHGDAQAGDNIFTLGGVVLPCNPVYLTPAGYYNWLGMLRIELDNGVQTGNDAGMLIGMVHLDYKNVFPVQEFGNGLSSTAYAFFIQDSKNEVMDSYPLASVTCGTGNYMAYRKLYSVLPDIFDFAMVMPGMPIFHPNNLGENVPYDVLVSNSVQKIGMEIVDNTAQFGSAGRLKSAIYHSFGSTDIFDHEVAHTWGAAIGQSLGLLYENYIVNMGHWGEMTDTQGQLGAYYFDPGGAVGHFAYNGNETWRWIANSEVEPYSPLELYVMGLIPPEQVPPIHILQSPNTNDLNRITVASYRTVTIDDFLRAEGGARIPSVAESQKDFNLAFIITQDGPYNDAAYAFFSLLSYELMSKDQPRRYSSLAPFYWATGGRATLNTRLPTNLPTPRLPVNLTAPGAAIQTSPSGTISTTTPTYTWNAVPNAAYYSLTVIKLVNGNGEGRSTWYAASVAGCSSGTGTCTITGSSLTAGSYIWYVMTENSYGFGPDCSGMRFTVSTSGAVTINDAIQMLQITSGKTMGQTVNTGADINGDGKLGLPEAIYIIQKASGIR